MSLSRGMSGRQALNGFDALYLEILGMLDRRWWNRLNCLEGNETLCILADRDSFPKEYSIA